mmetsp:Transcript_21728/g.60688  ORF Transcript_21728/g.60688 Transcript_21728/m.60688 type:complete len:217 (+) Transcript_21728:287-937(+)
MCAHLTGGPMCQLGEVHDAVAVRIEELVNGPGLLLGQPKLQLRRQLNEGVPIHRRGGAAARQVHAGSSLLQGDAAEPAKGLAQVPEASHGHIGVYLAAAVPIEVGEQACDILVAQPEIGASVEMREQQLQVVPAQSRSLRFLRELGAEDQGGRADDRSQLLDGGCALEAVVQHLSLAFQPRRRTLVLGATCIALLLQLRHRAEVRGHGVGQQVLEL